MRSRFATLRVFSTVILHLCILNSFGQSACGLNSVHARVVRSVILRAKRPARNAWSRLGDASARYVGLSMTTFACTAHADMFCPDLF